MRLLGRTPTFIWLVLCGATVLTTWVLGNEGVAADAAEAATFAVVAVKVRLILREFMDLRSAPLAGRLVFEGWALVVPALLTVLLW
jgi:hypothetical protein